jgi:hypothetical protein
MLHMPNETVEGRKDLVNLSEDTCMKVAYAFKEELFNEFVEQAKREKSNFKVKADYIRRVANMIDSTLPEESIVVRFTLLLTTIESLESTKDIMLTVTAIKDAIISSSTPEQDIDPKLN